MNDSTLTNLVTIRENDKFVKSLVKASPFPNEVDEISDVDDEAQALYEEDDSLAHNATAEIHVVEDDPSDSESEETE